MCDSFKDHLLFTCRGLTDILKLVTGPGTLGCCSGAEFKLAL